MSARERAKGAAAEREVIALMRDRWPSARRTSDGREQHARGDVANGPPGIHIEIKRQERLNVPAALQQAARDSGRFDVPVVIHRPSRCGWMATLPLDEVLALLALREAT